MGYTLIWILSTRDTYHITHSFAALTRSWYDMCHSLIKPISKCNPCNNLLLSYIIVLCLSHQYSSYSTGSSVGVWYDECDTTSVIRCKFYGGGGGILKYFLCEILVWNFFFEKKCLNFFWENLLFCCHNTSHRTLCIACCVWQLKQMVICKVKKWQWVLV